jgi:hypothetical protein
MQQMIADNVNFHIVCTLDVDDSTMNNTEVRAKLAGYSNTSSMWGNSYSKIHAFNRDLEDISGWDILVAVSDDMIFTVYGFDNLIREWFQTNAPDTDGLFHALDNDAKSAVPVLYIAGKKYYERDLWIYNPIYWSVFADNESMEVAKLRNRYFYTGIQILNHLNPAYGHLPRDEQFNRQQDMWGHDEMIYNRRRANNFGFDK